MFPSPLGEMGLSIKYCEVSRNIIAQLVSVPSRGNGVIDLVNKCNVRKGATVFPSPLGEMGLSICNEHYNDASYSRHATGFRPLSGKWGYRYCSNTTMMHVRKCFRPLSGKWGYRSFDLEKSSDANQLVSVPSRGNGVIDQPLTKR